MNALRGGAEAAATCKTRNWNIWAEAVELASIRAGVDAEWLRATEQRSRMSRAYGAGEAVWMVADEMIHRYKGVKVAAREAADGLGAIRAAFRSRVSK